MTLALDLKFCPTPIYLELRELDKKCGCVLGYFFNFLVQPISLINPDMQKVPIHNPVYLMLGASFGSAAKGTGLKALEFALSVCDTVDMYGFTVDPGYKEW